MISKDKTYRTRDGREVRIYATDGGSDYPVHGAILGRYGWQQFMWRANGKSYFDDFDDRPTDIAEVKPRIKRTVWMNVCDDLDYWYVYSTKENADKFKDYRLACVKVEIDCEEGEGL
jgi:hypothetical protein